MGHPAAGILRPLIAKIRDEQGTASQASWWFFVVGERATCQVAPGPDCGTWGFGLFACFFEEAHD